MKYYKPNNEYKPFIPHPSGKGANCPKCNKFHLNGWKQRIHWKKCKEKNNENK